jgi:hypothetical protein
MGRSDWPTFSERRSGRLLDGRPDAVVGYRTEMLTITDPRVIATSGSTEHPVIVPADDSEAQIAGRGFSPPTRRDRIAVANDPPRGALGGGYLLSVTFRV